jgi:hypothetical protein
MFGMFGGGGGGQKVLGQLDLVPKRVGRVLSSASEVNKKKKREKWVVSVVCLRSEFRKKGGSVLFEGEYVCMCVCMTHVCVCV